MNKQFWKNEAERLSESLCNKTMQGEQKVSLHQILAGYYPVIFKEYVKRNARKLLQEEHIIQINHSSRFNYDSLKLQEQLNQLKEAVLSETVFTRTEIEKFSRFMVAFQLDILLAPRQTFLNLTFRERNEFNKEAAIVILSGFDEERPFVRRLKEALERIDKDTIYRDEIYKIAEKIEQKVFKLTPISALLQEINCYIEFESAATGDHQTLVCSELLLRLLKERNQLTLFKQFEAEAHDKDFWTITEIENALERFLLVGGL